MLPTTRSALLPLALLFFTAGCQQKNPPPPVATKKDSQPSSPITFNPSLDKSALDMAYYPADYPILKMSGKTVGPPFARVIYSRPFKSSRNIFGNVVQYGKPWRLGANEATEIEFFQPVTIDGKQVNKGRYVLYCIPEENKWTIIFNGDLYSWGLKINSALDRYTFEVPVTVTDTLTEIFTMKFEKQEKSVALTMAWDSVRTSLQMK